MILSATSSIADINEIKPTDMKDITCEDTWTPQGIGFIIGKISNLRYVHSYQPSYRFHIDCALVIGFDHGVERIIDDEGELCTRALSIGMLNRFFICAITKGL